VTVPAGWYVLHKGSRITKGDLYWCPGIMGIPGSWLPFAMNEYGNQVHGYETAIRKNKGDSHGRGRKDREASELSDS
jgi:hypothetical protein